MKISPNIIKNIRVTLKPDSGEETSLCLFNLIARLQRSDIWKHIETNELMWTESKEYLTVQEEIHALQQEIALGQLTLLFPNVSVATTVGTNYYADVVTGEKTLSDHEGKFILRHAGFQETPLEKETNELRSALIDKYGKLFIQRYDNGNRQRQFRAKKASKKEAQVAWYLPTQLHKDISKQAKEENLSVNQFIVQILSAATAKDID